MKQYFFIILSSVFFLKAQKYVYPIATLGPNVIAFVHQHAYDTIELYVCDSTMQSISPALSFRYMPMHISPLPQQAGFSFVDNGSLYIKYFYKRSPKVVELADPLYDFNSMVWDINNYLYISAKQYNNRFALFQINSTGNSVPVVIDENIDFLYPQKQGENLFFISRSVNNKQTKYALSQVKFESIAIDKKENNKNKKLEKEKTNKLISDTHTLIDFDSQSIAFLSMDNEKSGFLVSYPLYVYSEQSNLVLFSYYHIYEDLQGRHHTWRKKKLFDFAIPLFFLLPENSDRLYEYIAPLLPKKIDNYIYYSHAIKNTLALFEYSLETNDSRQISFSVDPLEHFFCPIKIGTELYCGGSVASTDAPLQLKRINLL